MRIVFMGTPDFARKPLQRMFADGHDVACVFTQPDKPGNRGMKVSFSPVKELALAHGTPVFQPESLRDGAAAELLRELRCDIIVVVAYGKILPGEILDLPPHGCVNIHGSLLPKYRGAAPIQWAVINGEGETGVTSMFMAEEMDAGDIIFSRKTPIDSEETAGDLYDRLSIMGAELLSDTVFAVSRGGIERTPQRHSEATYAPPMKKDFSPIDWTETALRIKNKVRGLYPWPVSTTEFHKVKFKVFKVDIGARESMNTPGEIIASDENGLEVACADGSVIIKELQAPGGKRMPAADYFRGHRL